MFGDNGDIVSRVMIVSLSRPVTPLQVLLVTGGYSTVPLDSTEMLVGTGTWNIIKTASLPTGRWKPAAATINNTVYLFGEDLGTFPMLCTDLIETLKQDL